MKRNESNAGHRVAVTQNGHADPLSPAGRSLASRRRHSHRDPLETGETDWTNDRHLLAAVAHFGLAGAQCLNGSLQLDNLRGARLAAICLSAHSVRS
jgi:hypothetical protein